MQTNENEMGLKKIMDMTRLISVVLLVLHFYDSCYGFFRLQGWTHAISDQVLNNIHKTGLFNNFHKCKLLALVFLILSLLGVKAKKAEAFNYRLCVAYIVTGLLLYIIGALVFVSPGNAATLTVIYVTITGTGYLLFIIGGTMLFRVIKHKLSRDVFNTANETFPQEERLLTNSYSINLPTKYQLKNKTRNGWINIINAFRGGILLMGLPGSGKTLIAKEILKQQIEKGFAMFIHDFKYPDLTNVAYNHYLKNKKQYKATPQFYIINFEDIQQRCNPLLPECINSITDAASASRAILLGLNQEWIGKQGDFWVESSINFITALIWYLRLYQDGKYCTLPHVIELAQTPLDKLFTILAAQPSLEVLVMPFVRAYEEDAGKQLIGQISGAAISLGTLASEKLYYVLSGNDFSMNINDPEHPKIVCIANNPQVSNIYSAVISLYLNTLQKLLKEQQQQPCGILLEEFANISWYNADKFLSVCRSYLVNVIMVIQDASQLILHYGEKQAKVILAMVGNIISGQVTGESAKQLSERFGKIMQDRQSLTINSSDTSLSKSRQLDYAIPQSTIASLSAGEVVGVVVDNPDQRINQKMFHGQVQHDFDALKKEEAGFKLLPKERVDGNAIRNQFMRIKLEVKAIVEEEMERIMNMPGHQTAIVRKNGS
ncbi:YWFCY domain-containing protein [Niabella ginsengisoli]|uniref:YWFCY domain-containing protein n=1 Tax=Niabella ginsengisoli TaxID=522298 RepID=A0ABS9SI25_9BACT|nr:YWFCY domain-containing protein [Niabella ginsengisoli]MCH5598021.1 YWFCY domain-containing protein [Niabella ginsengisoli]